MHKCHGLFSYDTIHKVPTHSCLVLWSVSIGTDSCGFEFLWSVVLSLILWFDWSSVFVCVDCWSLAAIRYLASLWFVGLW